MPFKKGYISPKKGKTYEEIYGKEKAKIVKEKISKSNFGKPNEKLSKVLTLLYSEGKIKPYGTGFTKETHPSLMKVSKTRERLYREGKIKPQIPSKEHYPLIFEQANILNKQGFRCIPITKVVPDIIAIKGKDIQVFAVEVESGKKTPNYNKYTDDIKELFDDVMWIILKKKRN